ncbi:WD40-repeat-containing domain protein [Myxozyma melibiosi]|uniref:methylated diphthine methylhydrolase n=1 Tax=Myxozyma melibiosi TaxID=54550 RepID=A0ABR1F4I4_9ASCO
MTTHLQLKSSTTVALPPCALVSWPANDRFLIVGTYELEKESGRRRGSLDVYDIGAGRLELVNSVASPESSILDIKISPHDPSLLVSAHSTGNICVWRVREEQNDKNSPSLSLTLLSDLKVADDSDTLVLALSFSPTTADQVSVTLTSGEWKVLSLARGSDDDAEVVSSVTEVHGEQPHSLEAWISAFSADGSVLYTGGDDCLFTANDLRLGCQVWQDRRTHAAGVTSILTNTVQAVSFDEKTLWTGSYDDTIRVWDLRGARGKVVGETNLGGGVWRLVPRPGGGSREEVFACCMYDGGKVVVPGSGEDGEAVEVVRVVKEGHESMVYGADWTTDGSVVASCSFYDKQLNLWQYA